MVLVEKLDDQGLIMSALAAILHSINLIVKDEWHLRSILANELSERAHSGDHTKKDGE